MSDIDVTETDTVRTLAIQGATLNKIEGMATVHSGEVRFACEDGRLFRMMHHQDCCEAVWLEDVCGDPADLVGSPLIVAEVFTREASCETWTFYRFATVRGTVTLRWYGESNGYYSEDVDFEECVVGQFGPCWIPADGGAS